MFKLNFEKKFYIYILLDRVYCIALPYGGLIKSNIAIIFLERVQCQATLNDYSTDYKSRLIKLNLLSLMYIYKLMDILFLIKSLKASNISYDITEFISFSTSNTRFFSTKLCHMVSINNTTLNSYFLDSPDSGMLSTSLILCYYFIQSKRNLSYFYGPFYK